MRWNVRCQVEKQYSKVRRPLCAASLALALMSSACGGDSGGDGPPEQVPEGSRGLDASVAMDAGISSSTDGGSPDGGRDAGITQDADAGQASDVLACEPSEGIWIFEAIPRPSNCPIPNEPIIFELDYSETVEEDPLSDEDCIDHSVESDTDCALNIDFDCRMPLPRAPNARVRLSGSVAYVEERKLVGVLIMEIASGVGPTCEVTLDVTAEPSP